VERKVDAYLAIVMKIHARLLGNAELAQLAEQLRGVHIPADELLAEIGERAGLQWQDSWVIRMRGNSAQQMGRFGRLPSRESVVFFRKI